MKLIPILILGLNIGRAQVHTITVVPITTEDFHPGTDIAPVD
jgi:hypothetical protein